MTDTFVILQYKCTNCPRKLRVVLDEDFVEEYSKKGKLRDIGRHGKTYVARDWGSVEEFDVDYCHLHADPQVHPDFAYPDLWEV